VAVVVGAAIGKLLPVWLVALLTAFSFIGVAITMWRKPDVRKPKEKDTRILKGAMVAFATIFFSEWGDKGMVTAGTWAAAWIAAWHNATHTATGSTSALAATLNTGRLHELSLMQIGTTVWLASVMAMVTKGGLAVTLGVGIRTWIAAHVQPRYVRYAGVAALVVLGVLSVLEVLGLVTD
jgi:putative Ca2+/H+ antiporter (TMEM165/GDT1 family)